MMKPVGNRVFIKQDDVPKTIGNFGLIMSPENAEKPLTGTIMAVGDGRITKKGVVLPIPLKVGDKVLFRAYKAIKIDNPNGVGHFLCISVDWIFGTFTNE